MFYKRWRHTQLLIEQLKQSNTKRDDTTPTQIQFYKTGTLPEAGFLGFKKISKNEELLKK